MLSLLIVVDRYYECASIGSSEAGNIESIEKIWKFRDSMGSLSLSLSLSYALS